MAVRALRDGVGYRITHVAEEVLPFQIFTSAELRDEDRNLFCQAIQRLAADIPQSYWPLQIALPDPAAIFQVMEFDSLPQTSRERAAIAQFRVEKEFPTMPEMRCATQVLDQSDRQGLLLTVCMQRAWLDCLVGACREAGFVPRVMDIATNHIFNRFHDVIGSGSGDGALVSVEPDAWSILFWDATHRTRLVRSRWRDANVEAVDEYCAIAQDVERLIMSYILRVPGRSIEKIYLCATDDECGPMAEQLDKRMKIPCVPLDSRDSFSVAPGLSMLNIPPGVLASVIPRT